jgi:hypothetical protein
MKVTINITDFLSIKIISKSDNITESTKTVYFWAGKLEKPKDMLDVPKSNFEQK